MATAVLASRAVVVRLANFAVLSHLSFRGLFLWLNPWAYASNMFAAPLITVALYALVAEYATGRPPSVDLVLGVAMLAASTMANGGVLQSFTYERNFGTLALISLAPTGRIATYFSRGALHLPNAALAGLVAVVAAALVVGVDVRAARWDTVFAAVTGATAASVMLALALGNVALLTKNWMVLYGAANSLALGLTGAVVPRDALPAPLWLAGEAIPLTHALQALRAGAAGAAPSEVFPALLAEGAVALVWGGVGYVAYRWIAAYMRKEGTIDG